MTARVQTALRHHTLIHALTSWFSLRVETPEDEADNRDYAGDEGEDEEGVQ